MSLKKLFFLNTILKALDLATTWYFVSNFGAQFESNPIVLNMMQSYGEFPGLAINGTIYMALITLLYVYKRKRLLKIAAMISAVIPVSNFLFIILETIGRSL